MKVLVTAFKPFNKNNINYSQEVLKYIVNVDKEIIDVVYDKCYQDIALKYDLSSYDLIISLGEARSRNVLTLEVIAKNISSCSLSDNLGQIKKDEVINKLGLVEIETQVDVDKLESTIQFSKDAGKFVCNNMYYHLLSNYPNKSLFIHIPECNNDEENYIKYANIINTIINLLGE